MMMLTLPPIPHLPRLLHLGMALAFGAMMLATAGLFWYFCHQQPILPWLVAQAASAAVLCHLCAVNDRQEGRPAVALALTWMSRSALGFAALYLLTGAWQLWLSLP